MHILGLLLAAIGVIGVVLWRMQQAANATRDLADAAGEVRGLVRGWQWRRKAHVHPLDLVDDPREAAVVLMASVAQADAAISERERAAIVQLIKQHFGATDAQADELLARARWLIRETTDPAEVMRRMTRVVREKIGHAERGELLQMLDAVSAADGRQDETVAQDIRRFGKSLRT